MPDPILRVLSADEFSDLSNDWENISVDMRKYYATVIKACECDELTYRDWSGPKQIYRYQFFIGSD